MAISDPMRLALIAAIIVAAPVSAQELTVTERVVMDFRSVVARVEAGDSVTARSRLQGIVTELNIDEGDTVEQGQTIARVTDDTLAPQIAALASRIEGLKVRIRQQEEDVARAEALSEDGFFPRARLDEQRTALDVARRTLASAESERRVLTARREEGDIRAPADATVTRVNVVAGSIVSPGEVIATFATLDGVVRLALPERHAGTLVEGATLALRLPSKGDEVLSATIVKIYPELRGGAVIADAVADTAISALVGERVDVLVPVGERRAMRVPSEYIDTRYGVDFVRVRVGDRFVDAPVALASPQADKAGDVEILSGLRSGDVIIRPEPRS